MKSRISSLIVLLIVVASLIAPMLATTASAAGEVDATLSFADTAQRTTYTSSQQVWEQNGITLTNDKDKSQTNVGNYANPARFYKNSSIRITAPGNITQIVFACDSSSYATDLAKSIANSTSSGNNVTVILNESSSNTFTFTLSGGQVRLDSLTVTYTPGGSCEHKNTTTTTKDATCTEAGSTTVTCTVCEETVSTETIPATGHNYVDGFCSSCNKETPIGYMLVTDASTLKVGDQIVIVAKDANFAISTEQKSNNRGQAAVTKDGNVVIFEEAVDGAHGVQVITIKEGNITNTLAFYTGSGYLCAASSSSNYLRTDTDLSNESSWKITISDGVATIIAQGDYTKNVLQYNQDSSLFACYGSASQKAVCIYKAANSTPTDCEHTTTTINTDNATCTEVGSITVTCDDCGEVVSTEELPATGHTEEEVAEITATCTNAGATSGVKCSVCEEVISGCENIPALDHEYGDATCDRCGITIPHYQFVTPFGITKIKDGYGFNIKLPDLDFGDFSCLAQQYTFIGWSKSEISNSDNVDALLLRSNVEIKEDTIFYPIFSYTSGSGANGTFVKTDIANIKSTDVVVITMTTSGGTVYALTSANGSSKAPEAVKVSVSGDALTGDIIDALKWNITNDNGTLIIYPNGVTNKHLYCNSANDGVRVGTGANKTFTIDASSGYLKNTATSRYVGVYTTNPDWRCYTNTTGNTANQTLAFYVFTSDTTTTYTTQIEYNHTLQSVEAKSPSCIEVGWNAYEYCSNCSHSTYVELPISGHNETFVVTKEPTCTSKGQHTYTCTVCDKERTSSDILPLPHDYVNDVCSVCGYINSASLNFSGEYVIAAIRSSASETTYRFMQAALAGSKGDKFGIIDSTLTALPSGLFYNSDYTESLVIFVLEKLDNGNYVIYAKDKDGDNYLGCGDDHSAIFTDRAGAREVTVEKTINGEYNIYFIDEDEIIYLAFNSNHTYQYAGWYSSNQIKNIQLVPFAEKAIISAANLNLKNDLTMNFYVVLAEGENISDYTMKFEFVGKEYFANTAILYDAEKRMYYFSLTEIAPQYMTENIRAELIDGDGNVVAVKDNYTVKLYAMRLIAKNPDNESLLFLLADMLRYGAAAQSYQNHKTDELATKGVSLIKYPEDEGNSLAPMPTDSDNNRELYTAEDTGIDSADYAFTAAGLKFDFDNKIFIKFRAVDVSKVSIVIKVDGVEVGNGTAPKSSADGIYIVYSDGISATKFDTVYTFELYVDGTLHQTLTYSVNSYAYAKQASTTPNLANLVIALYRYGLSAKTYNPAQ